jgi:hypothetical protein
LKKYKIVGGIFVVSACGRWNKKIFKPFYLGFKLPSLLVDFLEKILLFLTLFFGIMRAEFSGCVEKQSQFAGGPWILSVGPGNRTPSHKK